jgi:hypothetical protein
MKKVITTSLLYLFLCSCDIPEKGKQKEQRKLYIFSHYDACININWYCYSTIGGFSVSLVDFVDKKTNSLYTIRSFYLSDVDVYGDTLKLELWSKDTSGLTLSGIPCFKFIVIDTNGDQNKNGIEARISRMIDAKIDYTRPHTYKSKVK